MLFPNNDCCNTRRGHILFLAVQHLLHKKEGNISNLNKIKNSSEARLVSWWPVGTPGGHPFLTASKGAEGGWAGSCVPAGSTVVH